MAVTLDDFERGAVCTADFGHADHVRIGYELLCRHEFDGALARLAGGLRAMALASGAPEKFHMTITVAFLSAIAERRMAAGDPGWEAFARANADLFDRRFLARWYSPADLASSAARRCFILPRRP
jgi:hypothetical protein